MRDSQQQINSPINKICSICNKENLIINKKYIKKITNSVQRKKLKENIKNIQPSEFIRKCYCKNLVKDNDNNNNDNDIYSHKFCILIKIIFEFELRCEKCNSFYNIKIDKKYELKKAIYLISIFILIYIIHLVIYLLIILLLFIDNNLYKNISKYKHLKYFFGILLFVINSIALVLSIINNIRKYKCILKYRINIFNIGELKIKKKFFVLLLDYYQWFYDKSIKYLLNDRHKKFIKNKYNICNYKEILKLYIKENNKEYDLSENSKAIANTIKNILLKIN